MYRIIKIENESFENICFYHIVEQSEDYQHINIYYQESINSPESLRPFGKFIISVLDFTLLRNTGEDK